MNQALKFTLLAGGAAQDAQACPRGPSAGGRGFWWRKGRHGEGHVGKEQGTKSQGASPPFPPPRYLPFELDRARTTSACVKCGAVPHRQELPRSMGDSPGVREWQWLVAQGAVTGMAIRNPAQALANPL